MKSPSQSLPRFPAHLEEVLLQFDTDWNQPDIVQLRTACPPDMDTSFVLELIRIDVQKRVAAGLAIEESFYFQAFPELFENQTFLQQIREITFKPLPVGDSILRALLHQVNLPTDARALPLSSTLPDHRYKLEGEIARGGMGAVLRGRDQDLGREIAVKVMLQNHAGKTELLQRFIEEAQIAGQLQHPGITPVYELGRFPDQRPYFTMKLVRGETLAKLLKDRPEPGTERPRFLKVFEQICQTLAYAHTRKVIHRDLKPHNIMVGLFGEVQVMDWGLAKVLTMPAQGFDTSLKEAVTTNEGSVQTKRSSGNSTDIPNTQTGSILGTPAYMAPEQARGDIDQLDERADVFGLGAILCEILTGRPPYVGSDGMEIYRQAVDANVSDAYTRLQQCGADPELISLTVRCLSVNREDRPRDASVLTKELTTYLHSVEDRLKKAELAAVEAKTKVEEETKRRRITIRLAAAILFTLLTGLAASLWQMKRAVSAESLARANEQQAKDERDAKDKALQNAEAKRKEAEINLAFARKGNELLGSVFTGLDPRREYATLGEFSEALKNNLKKAVIELEGSAIGDPLEVASMQNRLGLSLLGLGDPVLAVILFEKARTTRMAKLGLNHADTLTSMSHLAEAYRDSGKMNLALPLFEETLKLRKANLGEDHIDTLESMNYLAEGYREAGNLILALPLFEKTLKLMKDKLGPEHTHTLIVMNNLGKSYGDSGRLKMAVPLLEETFKLMTANLSAQHPHTLACMGNLATACLKDGKLDRAVALLEENLQLRRVKMGSDHNATLTSMGNLAEAYRLAGRSDKALPLLEETLKLKKAKLGADHPDTLTCMNNLAAVCHDAGLLDRSLLLFEEALKLKKVKQGVDHPNTLISMNNLAVSYMSAKRSDKALPLLEELLKQLRLKLGEDHPVTLGCMANLAEGYRATGKLDQALPLLEDTLKLMKAKQGADHPNTLTCMSNLAATYYDSKKFDIALPLYEETIRLMKVKLGPNHPDTLANINKLATNYYTIGKFEQALPLYEETLQHTLQKSGADHPDTIATMVNLGKAYCKVKQGEKAASLLQAVLAAERKKLPKDDPLIAGLIDLIAHDMLQCDQFIVAEKLLRESLAIRKMTQPDDWPTYNTQSMLGGALLGQKKYPEAEPPLLQGYNGMKKLEAKIAVNGRMLLSEALDRLIQLYTKTNKSDEVKKWQVEKDKLPKTS